MSEKEITVPATEDSIRTVADFVDGELDGIACEPRARFQLRVAVDELFSNIVRYAYGPEEGPATIRVSVEEDPLRVVLTFIDRGKPYDPLSAEDPDVTLPARERKIGGLGIFMVRKTMDSVEYSYENGQNILTVRKHVGPAAGPST